MSTKIVFRQKINGDSVLKVCDGFFGGEGVFSPLKYIVKGSGCMTLSKSANHHN